MAQATLHHGDNFSFVPNGTVDFVLTDPPFNISKNTNFATYEKNTIHSYQFDEQSGENWDSYAQEDFLTNLNTWSAEWSRVLRRGGSFAVFCADVYISHLMDAMRLNGLSPRRVITWRKNNAVPVNRQYMPMSANEYIIVGVKEGKNVTFNSDVSIENQSLDERLIESTIIADKVSTIVYSKIREALLNKKVNDLIPESHTNEVLEIVKQTLEQSKKEASSRTLAIYKTNTAGEEYFQACVPNYVQNPLKVGNRLHPTEKPVALLQFLVALYSNPNDLVLDGFGGSGSTGEAAILLGRNTIIVEREREFFEKLSYRLEPLAENILVV